MAEAGNTNAPSTSVAQSPFKVGDLVCINLDPDILKAMQEGHGEWNPDMAMYINEVGTVHQINECGNVSIKYKDSKQWTFHPAVLTKIQQILAADYVHISESMQYVKDKQKGHGGWNDGMKKAIGKVGKVLNVDADQDLQVAVCEKKWFFNPIVCTLLQKQILSTEPDELVQAAAQGQTDIVCDIISRDPDKVDAQSSGKTALQVACHQGHKHIVELLLAAGANLWLQDEDGDTALHYSVFGKQPEVAEMLLSNGALIDALNNFACSPLHVAVNKGETQCIQVLLQHKCDVNVQDSFGDTVLHDAISKNSKEIVELLVAYPSIDFTVCNNRGFNLLHHAALKGNNHATEKIVVKNPDIVDLKEDDGFTALHLAAFNGHLDVASTLLSKGKADIAILNISNKTALQLAVSKGHKPLIKLLNPNGSSIDEDDDQISPLLEAMIQQFLTSMITDEELSPELASQFLSSMTNDEELSPELASIHKYSEADYVQISESMEQVKEKQKGHGGWAVTMKMALGKVGKVLKVDADRDVKVAVCGNQWLFNPLVCTLLQKQILSPESDELVRETAQGHADIVQEIISKDPDKVNSQSSGKTVLQVACHQGHKHIVELLLAAGANLEMQDEDGDTALHYSVFGNQPEMAELLLTKGVPINALNNLACSPLHMAVNKQQARCVQVLLHNKCDVNIQDSFGDTVLHDAISKDSKEIVELLVGYPGIDFTLHNKRGFNLLHHAAFKGNNHATEKIVVKNPEIVDLKKDDGFTALHLAALNGHLDVASTLLSKGKADIQSLNKSKQTPINLAVLKRHMPLIELLMTSGKATEVQMRGELKPLFPMSPTGLTSGNMDEQDLRETSMTEHHKDCLLKFRCDLVDKLKLDRLCDEFVSHKIINNETDSKIKMAGTREDKNRAFLTELSTNSELAFKIFSNVVSVEQPHLWKPLEQWLIHNK